MNEAKIKQEPGKNEKVFKCTGICSSCGRCKDSAMLVGAVKRKTELFSLPDDFIFEKKDGYVVAFDIGTTTVVGTLIDLSTGVNAGSVAVTNPQSAHGLDVISRIRFADEGENNLELLHSSIVDCLNDLIRQLCRQSDLTREAIMKVVVAGNTTMSHIFAKYNPSSLARVPFCPAYTGTLILDAKTLGLEICDSGMVLVLPNIAGHVGGDITAGILATRLLETKELTLLIDIGTNGEIVLTDGKRTIACSTAAGPAFEGASIYQGMRAASGAIEKIQIIDGQVHFKTVGCTEPVGICGSGLIDAIAEMINAGVIKKNGRIIEVDSFAKKNPGSSLISRIRDGEEGREFVLVFKAHGEDIVITQNDIREVQLAKGAIAAGIHIMLAELGYVVEDIKKVMVAGAFGSFINKESAVIIGLLPQVPLSRIYSVGNTASIGVFMAAASEKEASACHRIPDTVEHIELADKDEFQKQYIAAMSFEVVDKRISKMV